MRRAFLIGSAVLGAASAAAVPARASEKAAEAFIGAFEAVCIPERLSYDGTLRLASAEGWTRVGRNDHPELATLMEKSDAGLQEAKEEGLAFEFRSTLLGRTVSGRPLHLVVSESRSEYIDELGCYVYDFEATEAVPSHLVTAILKTKPANAMLTDEITGYVWGPPPGMPRTLDTYLTFIPVGSPHAAEGGFDGQVLKFSTSLPDGER